MDVRVEMYRILLGCINSPDLTMHLSLGLGLRMIRTALDGFWLLSSHFNFEEYLGCRN